MNLTLALFLSPLLLGIIRKVKSIIAGRKGAPILQLYYDIYKLLQKGAVYSKTTTFVFRMGPIVGFSSLVLAASMVPFLSRPALLKFSGDILLVTYLLGLVRFVTVLAALDTGSAFEGMGASREVWFSALSEPAFLFSMAVLAKITGYWSISDVYSAMPVRFQSSAFIPMITITAVLFLISLVECSRIPFDDPTTHLELTMIHEVMVLDHSGPDLALIEWGSAIKLWIFGILTIGILIPRYFGNSFLNYLMYVLGLIIFSVAIGVVESIMARVRLLLVPGRLVSGLMLAILGFMLVLIGNGEL